jgi:hypothetical protein
MKRVQVPNEGRYQQKRRWKAEAMCYILPSSIYLGISEYNEIGFADGISLAGKWILARLKWIYPNSVIGCAITKCGNLS